MQIGLVLDLLNQWLHREGIVMIHLFGLCVVTLHIVNDAAKAVQILSIHPLLFIRKRIHSPYCLRGLVPVWLVKFKGLSTYLGCNLVKRVVSLGVDQAGQVKFKFVYNRIYLDQVAWHIRLIKFLKPR